MVTLYGVDRDPVSPSFGETQTLRFRFRGTMSQLLDLAEKNLIEVISVSGL